MNGQEKSQPRLSVERSSGSAAAASNGSTVPNGGASSGVNSTSWLKDMMANPLRAAQAGLISRPDDPSALLTGNFVYPYPAPFMFGNNPLSTLPRVGESISISSANLSTPAQVNQQRQQQQLLMQANIYGDIHSSQEKLPGSNSVKDASLKHPSSTVNMSSEILAKRSRTDCDNQPIHSHQMESVPMSTSSTSTLSTPNSSNRASIPHRPEYFRRGSIIQLGDNKLKRIEDLSTADFESSSQLNPDLCLDCSIVTKIIDEPLRGTAFLSFSIGEQCHDQVWTPCFSLIWLHYKGSLCVNYCIYYLPYKYNTPAVM